MLPIPGPCAGDFCWTERTVLSMMLTEPSSAGPSPAEPSVAGTPTEGGPLDGPRRTARQGGLSDPAVCAEARRLIVETTISRRRIARDLGVAEIALHRLIQQEKLVRPEGAPVASRPSQPRRRPLAHDMSEATMVVEHLLQAVDRQVAMIEARTRRRRATIEERDARMLGALAKTMQTLMALGRDDGAKQATEPADRDSLDADLARRIARWAEGREAD